MDIQRAIILAWLAGLATDTTRIVEADAHVTKHVQVEGDAGYIIVVGGLYHRLVHLYGRLEQSWHTFAT